jgi:aspartate racemase
VVELTDVSEVFARGRRGRGDPTMASQRQCHMRKASDMKTLGLIGGMSWESTAIYYRGLNEGVKARLGGLHSAQTLVWSFDFAEIAALQAAGDWGRLAGLMVDAGTRLQAAGAEALVICTNTMHKLVPEITDAVEIPLLHIADATAASIKAAVCRRPLLLATRYTMEQDFYKGRLERVHDIAVVLPDEEGRALVHEVIYEELCRGMAQPESRTACLAIIEQSRRRGADSVILGCTEIGMLIGQQDTSLPVFDSTAIHIGAALDFALSG